MADLVLNFTYSNTQKKIVTIANWNEDTDMLLYCVHRYAGTLQRAIKKIVETVITPDTPLLNLGITCEMNLPNDSDQYASGFLENVSGTLQPTMSKYQGSLSLVFFRKGSAEFTVSGTNGGAAILTQQESNATSGNYVVTSTLTKGNGFVVNCPVLTNSEINYMSINSDPVKLSIAGSEPETIDISTTLTNCEMSPTSVTVGEPATLTLKANDGYEFEGDPIIYVNYDPRQFAVSEDRKTATYELTAESGAVVSVIAQAVESARPPETIDISTTLTNCEMSPTSVTAGETATLTLKANAGYEFESDPLIYVNYEPMQFAVSEDRKTATYELTAESGAVVSVIANAVESAKPPKTARVVLNLSNVSIEPQLTEFAEGDSVTLVLTKAEKTKWAGTPTFTTNAFEGATVAHFFTLGDDDRYRYSIPSDAFSDLVESPVMTVDAEALPVSAVSRKYGICTLYKPTADDMLEVSKMRFIDLTSGEVEDLAQYITSLKSVPLDVETTQTADIVLGKRDTDINAPVVDDDEVTLDLGTVTVAGRYGNALDAENMTVEAVLPYVGIVQLDASKCANKSLRVRYRVNLISGTCVAMVFLVIGDDEVLLQEADGKCGFEVPYILKADGTSVINNAEGEILFNHKPAINVYQQLNASDGDDSVYKTNLIDAVGNLGGYNRASRIVAVSNQSAIMGDEMVEIEKLLKEGFIA